MGSGNGQNGGTKDRNLALIPETLDRLKVRSEPDLVVDLEYLIGVVSYGRPVVVVEAILVGNNRVEVVVPATELQHDEVAVPRSAVLAVA